MKGENILLGLVASVAVGANFGNWMQDVNAGFTAALVTWIAYTFRYDGD